MKFLVWLEQAMWQVGTLILLGAMIVWVVVGSAWCLIALWRWM